MNDRITVPNIRVDLAQCVHTESAEVLLNCDVKVQRRKLVSQRLAIGAELVGGAGEKQLHVRHCPPPASWQSRECGMAWRVRIGTVAPVASVSIGAHFPKSS